MDLTKRQQEIFDFIRRYSAEYGYPPTVRDIEDQREPDEQRPPEPMPALVGAGGPPTTSFGGGFSPKIMVRPSGLEPPRTKRSTRPSTLRVYQFRHRRRGGEYSRALLVQKAAEAPRAAARQSSATA